MFEEIPAAFTFALEAAVNRYLELDPQTVQKLASLEGRVIAIEFLGLEVKMYMIPSRDGLMVHSHYDAEPDTTLRGTPLSLLRMGFSRNVDRQLFSGDVEILGDTELGQRFKQIMDEMDIDWEEHVSHITGDVIAHQLGRGVRSLLGWGRNTGDTLMQDVSEYLQEEARLVGTEVELGEFMQGVDVLRNDVDRLEARVKRLQDKINPA